MADFDSSADQIVDTCLAQLGEDADQIELVRCVAGAYSTGLGKAFWSFSRNILLVYSTALVFYMQGTFLSCLSSFQLR